MILYSSVVLNQSASGGITSKLSGLQSSKLNDRKKWPGFSFDRQPISAPFVCVKYMDIQSFCSISDCYKTKACIIPEPYIVVSPIFVEHSEPEIHAYS